MRVNRPTDRIFPQDRIGLTLCTPVYYSVGVCRVPLRHGCNDFGFGITNADGGRRWAWRHVEMCGLSDLIVRDLWNCKIAFLSIKMGKSLQSLNFIFSPIFETTIHVWTVWNACPVLECEAWVWHRQYSHCSYLTSQMVIDRTIQYSVFLFTSWRKKSYSFLQFICRIILKSFFFFYTPS